MAEFSVAINSRPFLKKFHLEKLFEIKIKRKTNKFKCECVCVCAVSVAYGAVFFNGAFCHFRSEKRAETKERLRSWDVCTEKRKVGKGGFRLKS